MNGMFYRGEVYYVYPTGNEIGSEQHAGRPAIIVSNNHNNKGCTHSVQRETGMVWRVKQVRSLQEIDRDIAALRKDEQAYAHTKGHRFSPIVDDELDDLYAERMATLKALGDAGLKKYKALILPKPENKNSVCAACYVFYAKDSTQAYERGKEVFVSEFARYGVTAEDFDAEYDIAITSGENVK